MPPTQTTNPPLRGPEVKLEKKFRTYCLYYHFRSAAPLTKVFEHEGTFHEAIERGKVHCIRMNYRFIKVRPFIVDLDEAEARRNEESDFNGSDL